MKSHGHSLEFFNASITKQYGNHIKQPRSLTAAESALKTVNKYYILTLDFYQRKLIEKDAGRSRRKFKREFGNTQKKTF